MIFSSEYGVGFGLQVDRISGLSLPHTLLCPRVREPFHRWAGGWMPTGVCVSKGTDVFLS